jgi:hypothetical protein
VVWNSGASPTDPFYGIQGQRFTSGGGFSGGEFQVNTYTNGYQWMRHGRPIAVRPDGQFVVTWGSPGSTGTDLSGWSVQARQFPEPVFADGFESGDTTGWSATVP